MEPYDALLRDLQRLCTKPHGLIARAIAAIATLREQAKTWEERADYLRERCEDFRKRNDYLERVRTERNNDEEAAQIRQEMSKLQAKLGRIMEGLEGSCMTCEPVGVRNQQMEQHIAELKQQMAELRADRDALRRTLSRMYIDPNAFAASKGWDCFRESK